MNNTIAQIISKAGKCGIGVFLVVLAGINAEHIPIHFMMLGLLAVCIVLANIKKIVKIRTNMSRNTRRC